MNDTISDIVDYIDGGRLEVTQLRRYDDLRKAGAGVEELSFIELESYGGTCNCGVGWVRVEVRNTFAQYDYYEPGCRCYVKCYECEQSLHGHVPPKMKNPEYTCPHCGAKNPPTWERLKKKTRKRGDVSNINT